MITDPDEQVQSVLQNLLADGRLDEAIKLLVDRREEVRHREDWEESAHLGSLLGSCFRAVGRELDAEKAYLDAEREDPENPFLKVTIANFYVDVLNDPKSALPRIEAALPDLVHSPSTYHAAQASLGTVYLALGRVDEALSSFREMVKPQILNGLHPASHDLRLVSAFIDQKIFPEDCRKYLVELKTLSTLEGDAGTAETSEWLLGKL
jgi:tetratricopeptide (TPR) repeat protein